MSYIDAGYVVALVVLAAYALALVGRERVARRRLGDPVGPARLVRGLGRGPSVPQDVGDHR